MSPRTAIEEAQTPMSPPEAQPPPTPAKKCEIEAVLGKTVHELLKSDSTNKQVRAQCLNAIGREIPPELVEYDKIKEWIEFNIEPKKLPDAKGEPLFIEVSYSYTVVGTCRYRENRSGQGDVPINANTMREYVQAAIDRGYTMDELVELISELAIDRAPEHIDAEGDGGVRYDRHEPDDRENNNVEIQDDVESAVFSWLEDNDPDSLEILDGR